LIFIGVVFVGAIINYLIGTFVRKTPFSAADRALGSLFGLLRGVVFVMILILLCGLTPMPQAPWWQESYLIARVQVLSLWLKEQLPEEYAKAFNFSDKDEEEKLEKPDKKAESKSEKVEPKSENKADKKTESKSEKKVEPKSEKKND
jgi:membrane protein required for colicin V production